MKEMMDKCFSYMLRMCAIELSICKHVDLGLYTPRCTETEYRPYYCGPPSLKYILQFANISWYNNYNQLVHGLPKKTMHQFI